ncbi:MAG TPA: fumarylacetoacetase [Streptosporangiaceae bacterium]|nr:fumarylacetoacetase [Streptosporangiaceae bacterium]
MQALAYGSFSSEGTAGLRVGVAAGEAILDLTAAAASLLPRHATLFEAGNLDKLLAAGPATWAEVRDTLRWWLLVAEHRARVEPFLVSADAARMHLPFTVADYVDFYASEHHAATVGRLLRPGQEPLPPAWKHLPIGYHGRAGTVVVSGTPIARPGGQHRGPAGQVVTGPTGRLDLEAEVGFVVGVPPPAGAPVPLSAFADHVFGVCLVNDWSARDIQAFEYVPLGPFLGKSFATSVGAWVVPLAALDAAWTAPPPRDPRPAGYLDDSGARPGGLDIRLEVRLNGTVVSRPPFAAMYWTGPQQLAHLTVNGTALRTGDLFASGTVSGPGHDERGCLLELSMGGAEPLVLPDGTTRTFLHDGDEVVIIGRAPGPHGTTVSLGEVRGVISPPGPR